MIIGVKSKAQILVGINSLTFLYKGSITEAKKAGLNLSHNKVIHDNIISKIINRVNIFQKIIIAKSIVVILKLKLKIIY